MNAQSTSRPGKDYYEIAGIILIIGVVQYLLDIILAEALYPGYSVAQNYISDLGGSTPLQEPSATIFNISVIILGILSLVAVYYILKSGGDRLFSACLALFAIGELGVGLFPEYTGGIHIFFGFLIMFNCLAAIFTYRLGVNKPMAIVSMVLGVFSFLSLAVWIIAGIGTTNSILAYIGNGGIERFDAYPALFYLIAFGGYLTCRGNDRVKSGLRTDNSDRVTERGTIVKRVKI